MKVLRSVNMHADKDYFQQIIIISVFPHHPHVTQMPPLLPSLNKHIPQYHHPPPKKINKKCSGLNKKYLDLAGNQKRKIW